MCKHILILNFNSKTDIKTISEFTEKTHENDGYGAIIRTKKNAIKIVKSLDIASFYLCIGQWVQSGQVKDIVIHHRTSTNEAGIDYAHPFEFQGVYLTHNGVVTVPGTHATKTKNDSEALLHHLVKTGLDTVSVRGYFSCFMLDHNGTSILVDDTAPIYTDGARVYSSHKQKGQWRKIEKKHVRIALDYSKTVSDIEITKTDYGFDQAHLSLGVDDSQENWRNWQDEYSITAVDQFLEMVSREDMRTLNACQSEHDLKLEALIMADSFGLSLTDYDLEELSYLFFVKKECVG